MKVPRGKLKEKKSEEKSNEEKSEKGTKTKWRSKSLKLAKH
jgi:hypothetical protein